MTSFIVNTFTKFYCLVDLKNNNIITCGILSTIEIEKHEKKDSAIDKLRYRFGHYAVQMGISLVDTELSHINPTEDHVIHPTSYR